MCSDPDFPAANEVRPIVLDTNIVLDVLVFDDPGTVLLKAALAGRQLSWLATRPMRDELERVLAYQAIMKRMLLSQLDAIEVLRQFDALARIVEVASTCSLRCSDPDDQKFIDLALAHKAALLSKDRAVLRLSKRLAAYDLRTQTAIDFFSSSAEQVFQPVGPAVATGQVLAAALFE